VLEWRDSLMDKLSFSTLRKFNVRRCVSSFKHSLNDWSEAEWGNAIAGETGELCNLLKKRLRGESIPDDDVADEIADVIIYLDLLSAKIELNLDEIIIRKFNKTSDKRGCEIKFPSPY
jgi:NTP pyrophosphatase (non-canonical NTP hydrolase)